MLGSLIGWYGPLAAGVFILGVAAVLLIARPVGLVYLLVGLVVLGQAGRVPPGSTGSTILLMDGVALLLLAIWFTWWVRSVKLKRLQPVAVAWLGFVGVAAVSLVLSPVISSRHEVLLNGFYLARLVAYSSLAWILPTLLPTQKAALRLLRWVGAVAASVLLLGFVQLYVFPDIGSLAKYGWDPHVGRLVSTFLDPNFLGGFWAISLAIWGALFLSRRLRPLTFWIGTALLLVASVLTYSRSGYLAVGTVVLILGLRYSWKLLVLALCCAIPLALTIPRVQERVAGGFSLDTTSRDRIDSWQSALAIAERYPVIGVGYNNYHDAQEVVGTLPYGTMGHSTAGSDSSLLTILSTTGAVGMFLFFLSLILMLRQAQKTSRKSSVAAAAASALLVVTPALFVHSWFVNSLLYPFILVVLVLLIGLSYLKESDATA